MILGMLFLIFLLVILPPKSLLAQQEGIGIISIISLDEMGKSLSFPSSIFYGSLNDEIYLTNSGKSRIVIHKSDYFPILSIGRGRGVVSPFGTLLPKSRKKERKPQKKKKEEFSDICYVTKDESGRIYLLSEGMGRVYVYDKDENFLFKFGEKGGSTGKLSRPKALCVDEDEGGYIYC